MTFMRVAGLALCAGTVCRGVVEAQIVQRNAQFHLPASYNNVFLDTYPEAARSFYAAHFAHFGVYEVAARNAADLGSAMAALEGEIRGIITAPPRREPPITVIAPRWIRMAYTTGAAMDWTHHLHTQLYDILTDDRITDKRAAGERAISYYLSNAHAAFSTRGYGHAFMVAGGPWAGTFADAYPTINAILWAYHWHHAAIYEALMEPDSVARRLAVDRVIRTFTDSVLVDPPAYMPLTAEIAPRFGAMFPAAAHIFDNLHMMHDVVNDIMVDSRVPMDAKAREIERLLAQMLYYDQESVVPPSPMGHEHMPMSPNGMRVPTELPDGRWLPQGHPDARRAGMSGMSGTGGRP